jgi:hypothetical protein
LISLQFSVARGAEIKSLLRGFQKMTSICFEQLQRIRGYVVRLASARVVYTFAAISAVLIAVPWGISVATRANRVCSVPEVEIFSGVSYGCEQLERTKEGSGDIHWVCIDLTDPGIELYVTPEDRKAIDRGWQYRLRRVVDVVNQEHLAVGINGSLFTSIPKWRPRMSGDLAKGVETVVSDHVVSHLWEHTYLMWFDDQLKPYLRKEKPPNASDLASAKWGIGGQSVWLWNGEVWPGSNREPDARTAAAIDAERRLLFLAVGENISPRLILKKLADIGAKDGILLDGGGSTSMVIGTGARGVRPGTVAGGTRPVATQFGVRASRLHDRLSESSRRLPKNSD